MQRKVPNRHHGPNMSSVRPQIAQKPNLFGVKFAPTRSEGAAVELSEILAECKLMVQGHFSIENNTNPSYASFTHHSGSRHTIASNGESIIGKFSRGAQCR